MLSKSQGQIFKLTLHGAVVGYLAGLTNGRNIMHFATSFSENQQRPALSLVTMPGFQASSRLLAKPWVTKQRLHPLLSNLLPEGALRALVAQSLKTHIDNEFDLLSAVGLNLPGALIVEPVAINEVPATIIDAMGDVDIVNQERVQTEEKFSLAGVQMKFSMRELGDRFTFNQRGTLGDWIVKTPSTTHPDVPLNEYTAMRLAAMAGVNIPDIQLVDMSQLDNLPAINLPKETKAFAIKRFDRDDQTRVHMEDFAQVLLKYPHEKYTGANAEAIGKIIYEYSYNGLSDVQQYVRRLLINILLANGDAHLKNWSLYYPDKLTPRLSPAYDIVTTSVYMHEEEHLALNLAKTKAWYEIKKEHFEFLSKKVGVPWRAIKPHVEDVMDKARALWRTELEHLPMNDAHKALLKVHWESLNKDFRL